MLHHVKAFSPAFWADPRNDTVKGFGAMILVLACWVGFAVSLRAIGPSQLTPCDIALIRFGVPGVFLLFLLPSHWKSLRRVDLVAAGMVAIGGGLPFFLIAALGGQATSAAHVSAIVAGTMPVSVAFISNRLNRNLSKASWVALGIITTAVVCLSVPPHHMTHTGRFFEGVIFLLVASFLWGVYAVGLKRLAAQPATAAMVVTWPSLLLLLVAISCGAVKSHVLSSSLSALSPFLIVQGLGVGLLSTFAYAFAVRNLGASRCANIGALAPAVSAVVAVPILDEALTIPVLMGVPLIVLGVILANKGENR